MSNIFVSFRGLDFSEAVGLTAAWGFLLWGFRVGDEALETTSFSHRQGSTEEKELDVGLFNLSLFFFFYVGTSVGLKKILWKMKNTWSAFVEALKRVLRWSLSIVFPKSWAPRKQFWREVVPEQQNITGAVTSDFTVFDILSGRLLNGRQGSKVQWSRVSK